MTEIWASAGAGKTTQLALWAQELAGANEAVAWVGLAAPGNSPPPLPWLVRSACIRAGWKAGRDAGDPSDLLAARDFDPREFAAPLTIMIDDLHCLQSQADAEWLLQVCRERPDDLRVVLAGRYPPPLLAQLPLVPESTELRTKDLAFTPDETATFLDSVGIHLGAPEIHTVHQRTEGWTAALVLLAGWLKRDGHVMSLPDDFGGDHRAVADYLVNEVLSHLPEESRDFLLTTSVTDTLTIPLAAHLTGRPDAGAVLEELEARTALVSHTTDVEHVYTYHSVLLSYLRAESRRRNIDAHSRAQRTAADWYLHHDRPETALDILLRTETPEALLDFLDREGMGLIFSGHSAQVKRALESLAAHGLSSVASRLLEMVVLAPYLPDTMRADFRLTALREPVSASRVDLRLIHAALVALRADSLGARAAIANLSAVEDSATAPGQPLTDATLDALIFCALARATALRCIGNLDGALAVLGPALESARQSRHRWLYLNMLDLTAAIATQLNGWSEALAYRDMIVADTRTHTRSSDLVSARLQLSVATDEFYEGAEPSLSRIEDILRVGNEHRDLGLTIPASALRLLQLLDLGREERTHLDELHRLLRVYGQRNPLTVAMCSFTYESLTLRLHDRYRAREARNFVTGVLEENSLESTIAAALYSGSSGRLSALEPILERALVENSHAWDHASPALGWLLLAKWAEGTGRAAIADARLVRALATAEPLQVRRPFLADGEWGADMVESRLGRLGSYDEFADSIVELSHARKPVVHVVPRVAFTQKEREILRELPRHQSISDIADKQRLSPNTVKTHLRAIYQKLGVSGRTAAVETALAEGLL
ncbi:MAG: LuxR C-terminal-related transcriptional regulator [Mycetocola sp.]